MQQGVPMPTPSTSKSLSHLPTKETLYAPSDVMAVIARHNPAVKQRLEAQSAQKANSADKQQLPTSKRQKRKAVSKKHSRSRSEKARKSKLKDNGQGY
ncbi:MAG: hypothetical protein AAF810_02310 [Cyanobacteria bacterium P01_D01_bin.36]